MYSQAVKTEAILELSIPGVSAVPIILDSIIGGTDPVWKINDSAMMGLENCNL